ncbi:hypothetical protein HRG_006425 [Hirsutella rhossiliensis]|uniref:Uncharacterized protein n=1 Tax=Hirsutella rhossiliensis TaxID=111463 RepID=A0A9P8MUF3_9HYPO|nr:uncharacterized protein HRG_06425 [Hirsutella rhossiliensis]KAH0962323.1 hypothetical protein HRG_06425 [Hirsutella rhossiliensis]
MLRRWSIAPRRAFAASLPVARPRIAARPVAAPRRNISLLPWRRNRAPTQPPLPVYFSRGGPVLRPGNWKGPLGRVLFALVAYTVCWQIYVSVVFDPLLDWADTEWNALSEEEKDEVDQAADPDEPILFLPFPFMTKLVEQPPYKGSDPEWSTFIAVSKDQQLQKDIKRGLAETIRSAAAKNPQYIKALGGHDIKLRKYWLDILYPPRPPPKHYMSGIIVFDDGIYWGDRPIDSATAGSLSMALYPKAVAAAVWSFGNSLVKQTAHDVANALRLNPPTPPPEATDPQHVVLQTDANRVFEASVRSEASTGSTASSIQPAGDERLRNTSSSEGSGDPRIQAALHAASGALVKNWQQAPPLPNRGCIRVDGMVEIYGDTAILCVYVLASYDPKLKKYVGIQTGLKHLAQLKQRPASG